MLSSLSSGFQFGRILVMFLGIEYGKNTRFKCTLTKYFDNL